jgi:hypothetical protein
MIWLLYPQGTNSWYPLDRRLGGPQSRSGRGGDEKNSMSCQDSNSRSSSPYHSAISLTRIKSKLFIFSTVRMENNDKCRRVQRTKVKISWRISLLWECAQWFISCARICACNSNFIRYCPRYFSPSNFESSLHRISYGERSLSLLPVPTLVDHPFSADHYIRSCSPYLEVVSSIPNWSILTL